VRKAVLALLVLALVVRLAVIATTPDYKLYADPGDYQRHAVALSDEGRYPPPTPAFKGETAYRPPGYPVFLAAVYTVTPGHSVDVARVAQALLGTLTVALTSLVARQLFGRRVGLAALALAAVYPSMWMIGNALLSEVLLTPLVLGAVAAALHYRLRDPRLRWIVLAGVLAGLATLTRQNALLMLVPLVIAALPPRGERRTARRYAPAALAAAAALLTIAPWTIRNAAAVDAFVPVSTQDGFTLAGTYNDMARDQERWPAAWVVWFDVPENLEALRGMENAEPEWSDALRSHAIDYAREHPGYVVKVAWWNLRRDFDAAGVDWIRSELGITATAKLAVVELVTFWLLAALAIGGAATAAARRAPWWVWLVPLSMVATVFVVGYLRFRAPVDPFVVMLAALGAVALIDRVRGGEVSRRRTPSAPPS
jgi:4-amino-4-deoxy-L-arabinose transferase-like glycosyltransferase